MEIVIYELHHINGSKCYKTDDLQKHSAMVYSAEGTITKCKVINSVSELQPQHMLQFYHFHISSQKASNSQAQCGTLVS